MRYLFVQGRTRTGEEITSSALILHNPAPMNNLSWFAMKSNIKDTVEQQLVNYDDEKSSELCDQRTTKHFVMTYTLHALGELEDLNWSPHSRICYPIFPPREYFSWKPIDTCLGHP